MTDYIQNYRALQAGFDGLVANLHSYWKSLYLAELTDDALAFIHERAMARPDPSVLIHVLIMGGSTATVATQDTAFGDRSAPFMLSFDGGTYDPAKFDAVRDWVRDSVEAARRLDGAGGAYLNFSGDDATDERVIRQQFGDDLERLSAVKKQYDPDNLFRTNNNVRPS